MKRNLILLAVGALALGVLAAGCGSSNDNSTSTSSLTKAEWIAKADAICKASNDQINAAGKQQFGNQKPSQDQLTSFATGTIIPQVGKQLDQIDALGVPSGSDGDQASAVLAAAQADLGKVRADPSLVTSNSADPFADANKLAKAYGMKVCGS